MNIRSRIDVLPAHLRSAMRIWLAMALISLLLPASAVTDFGLLAHSWFWAGLLPMLAVTPYLRQLIPARRVVHHIGTASEYSKHIDARLLWSIKSEAWTATPQSAAALR